jgi:hypothetical protein
MEIKSLYIYLFILTALLQVAPCFSQSNFAKPQFRLLTYGEPSSKKETYEFVGQRWGIEFYPVAGCVVTQELIDSVKYHNQEIESLIIKKYGVDWKSKFDNEINAEFENQNTVIALVEETDFIKNNKALLQLENDQIIYRLTPILNTSKYHVIIPGWISIQGKKEWVTFYKLLVDYKTKSVAIE